MILMGDAIYIFKALYDCSKKNIDVCALLVVEYI